MTTKAQQEKEAAAEAAAAAALDEAVAELVATGMDPVAAAAQARAAAETPLAGPDDGGFTGPGTKEPDANPKEATAKRARRGRAVKDAADAVPNALTDAESRAEAANILGCHVEEVLVVEDLGGNDWPVATTFDGQKYQLTGSERGDFVWLQTAPGVPQLLGGR